MSEDLRNVSNEAEDQNENSENVNAATVSVSGEGSIEYDAGSSKNPMEDLVDVDKTPQEPMVEQDDGAAEMEPQSIPIEQDVASEDVEETPDSVEEAPKIVELEEGEVLPLKESERPGFDPNVVQDARYDKPIEGGIVKTRSTGQMKQRINDPAQEGSQIKPVKINADSIRDKFEVTGFTVEFSDGDHIQNKEILDYFDDIETAQASINSDKYLMPVKGIGYKIATIVSGAPIICYNERQIYGYVDESWSRTS